jgi:hypothetical protein
VCVCITLERLWFNRRLDEPKSQESKTNEADGKQAQTSRHFPHRNAMRRLPACQSPGSVCWKGGRGRGRRRCGVEWVSCVMVRTDLRDSTPRELTRANKQTAMQVSSPHLAHATALHMMTSLAVNGSKAAMLPRKRGAGTPLNSQILSPRRRPALLAGLPGTTSAITTSPRGVVA